MVRALGLLFGLMALNNRVDAAYTVGRPVDNLWGTFFDHTYTTNDDWSCYESFGGDCSCDGQSPCYWYEHGSPGASCTDSWFSSHWTYASQGVCHQSANNNAWYMGSAVVSWGLRGMGWSTGIWGYYGTDGGC
jgi:hypothetical protein